MGIRRYRLNFINKENDTEWSDPEGNQTFFGEMRLTNDRIIAAKADAAAS
jgi:hypothetical protein